MARADYAQEAYRRVWDAFLRAPATTDGRHDTAAWRAHDGPYVACVARVDASNLQPNLSKLDTDLSQLDGVRVHPEHFLHIMLQELGFVVDHPKQHDEIGHARLEEFALSAVEPVASVPPFAVTLGGVNAFEDAVFLEVSAADRLSLLHSRLFELAALTSDSPYLYLPHCTVAHFDGTCSPRDAARVIEPWRQHVFGSCEVTEIEIVMLDPQQTYPRLESYAVILLGG